VSDDCPRYREVTIDRADYFLFRDALIWKGAVLGIYRRRPDRPNGDDLVDVILDDDREIVARCFEPQDHDADSAAVLMGFRLEGQPSRNGYRYAAFADGRVSLREVVAMVRFPEDRVTVLPRAPLLEPARFKPLPYPWQTGG
jgi:hypothetical protein